MKKRLAGRILCAALLISAVSLSACGNKDQEGAAAPAAEAEQTADAAAEDGTEQSPYAHYPKNAYSNYYDPDEYVEVADYSSLTAYADLSVVTDEMIEQQVQLMLEQDSQLAELTDRDTVEEGDIVNIDYEGKIDGVAFDGGTAKGFDLEIGSGRFIEGFEEGLIGAKKGETRDVTTRFPDPYPNSPDLAGKEAIFTVTVNKIQAKYTPELTDEYVTGLGATREDGTQITTVDEYRAVVKEYLDAQAENEYGSAIGAQNMNYLMEQSTFKQDPPVEMVDRMEKELTSAYTTYAASVGADLQTFMTYVFGSTEESYLDDIRADATDYAKRLLLIQAIAKKENLSISDEELAEEEGMEAIGQGMSIDDFEANMDLEGLREGLLEDKVLEVLREHTEVKPEDEAPAALQAEEELPVEEAAEAVEETAEENTSEEAAEEVTSEETAETAEETTKEN